MDFTITSDFDSVTNIWNVKPAGEIDVFNSPEFKRYMFELVESQQSDIRLMCNELSYIDSTALGALISILKRVKEYDGNIYIESLRPNLFKLFSITNLDKIFIITDGD